MLEKMGLISYGKHPHLVTRTQVSNQGPMVPPVYLIWAYCLTATSFFLPHQNLAKSHHLSSGAKDSKPLKYINTDIREQNIYNYD